MVPQVKRILDYWFVIEVDEEGSTGYCLAAPSGEGSEIRLFKTEPIANCFMGVVTTVKGERYGIARANPVYKEMLEKRGIEYNELDPIPEELWTEKS